jgi:hypothetical protein
MIIDTTDPASVAAFLFAIITAIWAWYQKTRSADQVQALTPGTPQSVTPAVVATLPERSWKMNDVTKYWLVFDATPENKTTILQQVDEAEAQHLTHYFIHFNGGYQEIEYGLVKGGAGNPSGGKGDNYIPPPVVAAPVAPIAAPAGCASGSACQTLTGNCPSK